MKQTNKKQNEVKYFALSLPEKEECKLCQRWIKNEVKLVQGKNKEKQLQMKQPLKIRSRDYQKQFIRHLSKITKNIKLKLIKVS